MPARIYQRFKSTMQSGRARVGTWMLEHEPAETKRADPLTGWAGSNFTEEQVSLAFASLDAARAYAERMGIAYHLVPADERPVRLQSYADNFQVGAVTPVGE